LWPKVVVYDKRGRSIVDLIARFREWAREAGFVATCPLEGLRHRATPRWSISD